MSYSVEMQDFLILYVNLLLYWVSVRNLITIIVFMNFYYNHNMF